MNVDDPARIDLFCGCAEIDGGIQAARFTMTDAVAPVVLQELVTRTQNVVCAVIGPTLTLWVLPTGVLVSPSVPRNHAKVSGPLPAAVTDSCVLLPLLTGFGDALGPLTIEEGVHTGAPEPYTLASASRS